MGKPKFNVGDKVVVRRLNNRTPLYIREAIRMDRARTIVGVWYDPKQQHALYHLGNNNRGDDISDYGFRAEQLRPAGKQIGRPRQRRKYERKVVRY